MAPSSAKHNAEKRVDTPPEVSQREPGENGDSDEAKAMDQPEELADSLAEKNAQIAKLQQELLYQRAEFENFRKRTEKRYRDALDFATEPFAKDLLAVVDNLDRALAHAKDAGSQSLDALTEGVGHVLVQFQQILGNHGVWEVPARGEKFDPNVHESLAQVPGEDENRVVDVYEKGYLLKGRLLRPAKVVISRIATPERDG